MKVENKMIEGGMLMSGLRKGENGKEGKGEGLKRDVRSGSKYIKDSKIR